VKPTPPRGPDAKMTALRLDLTPKTEDSTIGKYHARVSSQLQPDPQLMMPFGEQLERIKQDVNASAFQYCDVLPYFQY
jgi:hypothetical protein